MNSQYDHPMRRQLVDRFDKIEIWVHWLNAALFGILMLSALPLYFVEIERYVGRRLLIEEIHTWTGIFLPIPLVLSALGRWGSGFRGDIKRFSQWRDDEILWLKSLGRDPMVDLEKFNPGQKLNALFIGSSVVVMLGTGLMLKWFGAFPLNARTGATFVHDLFAAAIFVVVVGHIFFAVAHREALKSIFSGRISRSWAQQHAPRWLREIDSTPGGRVELGVDHGRLIGDQPDESKI